MTRRTDRERSVDDDLRLMAAVERARRRNRHRRGARSWDWEEWNAYRESSHDAGGSRTRSWSPE